MGAQTGSTLTAVLTPRIPGHFGWTASFLTASTLCALGAVTWFLVDPERVLLPEKGGRPKLISQQPRGTKLKFTKLSFA
jgi:dipeptide/tripeptide permease